MVQSADGGNICCGSRISRIVRDPRAGNSVVCREPYQGRGLADAKRAGTVTGEDMKKVEARCGAPSLPC